MTAGRTRRLRPAPAAAAAWAPPRRRTHPPVVVIGVLFLAWIAAMVSAVIARWPVAVPMLAGAVLLAAWAAVGDIYHQRIVRRGRRRR